MKALQRFCVIIILLAVPSLLVAQNQNAGDAAKEKQQRRNAVISQILADLPNLKLGENRAVVYARTGNMVWDTDQKQSRALFQSAVSELINVQAFVEANQKRTNYQGELLTGGSTRPQILNLIAARDAELALSLLVKTRPAAITKALTISASYQKNPKISDAANSGYLAQSETNLEQTFIRMAANQNPERSARLIKEAIAKGITNETLSLLNKLAESDPDAAASLASECVDKLIQSKYRIDNAPNYQELQQSIGFLNQFVTQSATSGHVLKLEGGQMHRLADKLFTFCLEPSNPFGYIDYSIIPLAEKLSPGVVDQLKKASQTISRRGDFSIGYDPDLQKLLSGESTADQLLAEAKNYPVSSRRQIYQTAANKLVQQGNPERAEDVLNDNFSDDALSEAMRNLKYQVANDLTNNGRFAEAERVVDELPENVRLSSLVNLANSIFQKDRVENRSYAIAVLGKARSMVAEKPENAAEMSSLMQVIGALANIDPTEAFRMYEQLVPQMNELSDAGALITGFQGSGNVREGEFTMSQGNSYGYYGPDYYIISTFSGIDFDRTNALIDSFARREIRISLKLQLLESGLN